MGFLRDFAIGAARQLPQSIDRANEVEILQRRVKTRELNAATGQKLAELQKQRDIITKNQNDLRIVTGIANLKDPKVRKVAWGLYGKRNPDAADTVKILQTLETQQSSQLTRDINAFMKNHPEFAGMPGAVKRLIQNTAQVTAFVDKSIDRKNVEKQRMQMQTALGNVGSGASGAGTRAQPKQAPVDTSSASGGVPRATVRSQAQPQAGGSGLPSGMSPTLKKALIKINKDVSIPLGKDRLAGDPALAGQQVSGQPAVEKQATLQQVQQGSPLPDSPLRFGQIKEANIQLEMQTLLARKSYLRNRRDRLIISGQEGKDIANIDNTEMKNINTRMNNLATQKGQNTASEKAKIGRVNMNRMLTDLSRMYKDLRDSGGLTDPDRNAAKNLGLTLSLTSPGQFLTRAGFPNLISDVSSVFQGKVPSPENRDARRLQGIRDRINMMRPGIIAQIKQSAEMGATQLNSEKELDFYMQITTDVARSYKTNIAAIQVLSDIYGLGTVFTDVDVTKEKAAILQEQKEAGLSFSPRNADVKQAESYFK